MKQYLDLLRHVLDNGVDSDDRTGVGTRRVFGYQMRINLAEGFPLLTTKKMYTRAIIHELLWFLKGDINIRYLVRNNVHIWDEWPFQDWINANGFNERYPMYSDEWQEKKKWFIEQIKEDDAFAEKWGDLGPVYGKQWIRWEGIGGEKINQIQNVLDLINNSPSSRRIIVSGWNVADIQGLIRSKTGAPPPCHTLFQFAIINGKLSCQLYQRSADSFLGVPFNIASYSLLTMMIAHVCELELGDFVHTFGDLHIYKNHFDQVREQLGRQPRDLPRMRLNDEVHDLFGFEFGDFELIGYDNPHPSIKAPIAV